MKKNLFLIAILFVTLPSAGVFAQKKGFDEDGPTGIFESRAEYGRFMGGAKRAAYGENGSAELQAMIPLLNDIALGREIGATARQYNSAGSELGLLSNKSIREDIEMVDEQYEDLQQLNAELKRRMGEQLREVDFSQPEDAVARIREIRDQAQEELNALLLPHQVSRLKQIRMQALLRKRSLLQILTSDPIKSDLEISESQMDKLRDAEDEIRRKLSEKIAKLQEEARDELISNLDASQQREVKEMIGDAFDLSTLNDGEQKSKGKNGFGKDKAIGKDKTTGKQKKRIK